jgi:predicted Zn-dependent protease with MMP-like domain
MKREHFVKVVEESLDSLPQEFRSRIRNVAVLVEEMPPNRPSPQSRQRRLLLGLFHGVVREQICLTVIHELGHFSGWMRTT